MQTRLATELEWILVMTNINERLHQYNVSDDEYVLVEIMVSEVEKVEAGQHIATFEGSKAAYEVEASTGGYVAFSCGVGDVIKVNEVFATVYERLEDIKREPTISKIRDPEDANISAKARNLLEKNNLDIKLFSGKDIIRVSDVENYISEMHSLDLSLELTDRSLLIVGIGSQADVVNDIISEVGDFEISAYVDYKNEIKSKDGLPVISLHQFKSLTLANSIAVYVCLPDRDLEKTLVADVQNSKAYLVNVISRTATVSPRAKLGRNVFIGPNCLVGPFADIGDNVRMLNGSSVAHHSKIGAGTWICDGATVGGNVEIGNQCLIGLNSSVNKKIKIGHKCVITSGTNVSENKQDGVFVR